MRDLDKPAVVARRGVFAKPTLSGSWVALLFWWQALTPTLIPRSWQIQVFIGAVCLAIGYGIGGLIGRGIQRLLERSGRVTGDAVRRGPWIVLTAAWLVALLFGATRWLAWQNEQREFMGMEPVVWPDGVLMSALSLLCGALLVILGRVISKLVAAATQPIHRRVPATVSVPATALLLVALGFVLSRSVVLRALTSVANAIYAPVNERTTEGILAPESPSVSGSSASLIPWATLGRMGRDFVSTATTRQELALFHGGDASLADPVRVYVGLGSADTAAERAQLAVRELERAGGFERKVLVVWVPTGTGWIVPKAAVALEQLHRGDTAIVAVQYSFLPSLLAVFMDAGLANEAGIALFTAVREHWSRLPPGRRPKLVLFGKSLGTAGVEAPFVRTDASSSVSNLVTQTDGALLAGPKQSNVIRSQLTRERDPSSPIWQPVFEGGRCVRFLNRYQDRPASNVAWPGPRIAYLQHPGDPTSFWNIEVLWWPPEWMRPPRGPDVPNDIRWFPLVSAVQAVGDFIGQLGPPPGFGHDYSTEYVKGWASVVPPDGWKDADTERLEHFIAYMPGDDSEQ